MQHVIEIKNGIARNKNIFQEPINISFEAKECVGIVGPNGAGKSQLVDIITGRSPLLSGMIKYNFSSNISNHVYDNVSYVSFIDVYGTAEGHYYYQQRWNQTEIETYPTVSQLLNKSLSYINNRINNDTNCDKQKNNYIEIQKHSFFKYIYTVFDIKSIENKKIVMLSSGESRRFQFVKALLTNPQVLIIDNPFIGLDSATRKQMSSIIKKLYDEMNILIIMILSSPKDVPDFITNIIEVNNKIIRPKISKTEWLLKTKNDYASTQNSKSHDKIALIYKLREVEHSYNNCTNIKSINNSSNVVEFKNVTIKYGDRIVLDNLSFTIKNNEHWAITGANGSGKSTLLGIIYADNPQAYANNIVLFGHKRGEGESIWDIKKHIGYISPEIHRSYMRHIPAINVVASGLRDTVGLYITPSDEDLKRCRYWMDILGIERLANRDFMTLSNGEQRLALLSRVFVKDPSLLLLDEPFHGLDLYNRQLVTEIIYEFCKRENKTLIMVSHFEEEFPNIIDHRLQLG